MEPGFSGWPGELATWTAVSVWPKPSRIVTPQARRTCSMTSGFSGSPAATTSRGRVRSWERSAWISIRHTVGGAQKLVTGRAVHLRHQPGRVEAGVVVDEDGGLGVPGREEVGPGVLGPAGRGDVQVHVARLRPIQYIVARWPIGYEAWVCSTSLGRAVVPEVKYSISGSSARVGAVRLEGVSGLVVDVLVGSQPVPRAADRDPGVVPGDAGELLGVLGAHDHMPAARPRSMRSARSSGAEQRGGGDDDGAQLHRGERGLPQLGLVAEHDDDAVARPAPLWRAASSRPGRSGGAARRRSGGCRRPSSSTMCRAVRSLPAAMRSNQSSAQLKCSGRGQGSPRRPSS